MSNRMDYLDAVRAFALLLGIVFHASLSFVPVFIGWAVMDISTSSNIGIFLLISHSFRMALFFLIAGFFSHMTLVRKGAGTFIKSRLLRIAIPFVAGWFILRPLIVSSWVMGGESMRGQVDILNGLKSGFLSLAELPRDLLTGTHLWFLYYLLLITAIVLTLRWVLLLIPGFKSLLASGADRLMAWLCVTWVSPIIAALPIAGCLWYMNGWGMDTPDKSLLPEWPVLAIYGGFFSLGWLVHRQDGLMEKFGRITVTRVVLLVTSVLFSIGLSVYQADPGHPQIHLIRLGFVISYAVMMWSLVFLSIGMFKRFLDKPSRSVRYVADASYWLYLLHLPVVVWLQVAFAELSMHWALKLAAISLITIGLSLVLYELFVRYTWLGWILNGKKRNRNTEQRRLGVVNSGS